MAALSSDSVTPAKMYEVLQASIKETDEISFKLLGLVPLVNGAALLTAVLDVGSPQAPAIVVLSLFGAVVTLGLFWWELRNIRYCLWYIALAGHFERAVLHQLEVPAKFCDRPPAPGGVGKRKAEKLIYSTVIFSWLALPVMLLGPDSLPIPGWAGFGVLSLGIAAWTIFATRVDVEPFAVTGKASKPPLFAGDDYRLVTEAAYREEARRELFKRLHGVDAPEDEQLDRLADLAQRISEYMKRTGQV